MGDISVFECAQFSPNLTKRLLHKYFEPTCKLPAIETKVIYPDIYEHIDQTVTCKYIIYLSMISVCNLYTYMDKVGVYCTDSLNSYDFIQLVSTFIFMNYFVERFF